MYSGKIILEKLFWEESGGEYSGNTILGNDWGRVFEIYYSGRKPGQRHSGNRILRKFFLFSGYSKGNKKQAKND